MGAINAAARGICKCKPYTPVMDRGYPDTATTEMQRLTDLAAIQSAKITTLECAIKGLLEGIDDLKRAAQEQALQSLSDMAQADDALAKKDAEIAKMQTGHDLYEVVRRMSVPQFRGALARSLGTGESFDNIVAGMAPFFGLTVRRG